VHIGRQFRLSGRTLKTVGIRTAGSGVGFGDQLDLAATMQWMTKNKPRSWSCQILYRYIAAMQIAGAGGISWTIDPEKAAWFANRSKKGGKAYVSSPQVKKPTYWPT
jgi:hypothetical protein